LAAIGPKGATPTVFAQNRLADRPRPRHEVCGAATFSGGLQPRYRRQGDLLILSEDQSYRNQSATAAANSDDQRSLEGQFLRPIGNGLARWGPPAVAGVLILLICLKAIVGIDLVWDSLAYHLPFTALRSGILTKWQFQLHPGLRQLYLGSPVLGDLLRGWLWRLSGRPEAVNLLGVISLLGLVGYLKWAFRLEAGWTLIGLLAIPAVQTAAAGNYLDLPANAMLAALLFAVCDLWINPERYSRPAPWIALLLAAGAAGNIKLHTGVLACLAYLFTIPPFYRILRRSRGGWAKMLPAIFWLGGALLVSVNFIKNSVFHRNPIYPLDVSIAGLHLPGPWTPGIWFKSGGPYDGVPGPISFFLSALEYHSLDGRPIPYTNGMGDVPATSLSAHMGGSFSALLVASICFLILALIRRRDKWAFTYFICFLICTAIIAFVPNARALRYVMFWMMFLVIGCLVLLQRPDLAGYARGYKIILFGSLAFVTSVTGAIYFTPVWHSMQNEVDRAGVEKLLQAAVAPGEVICLPTGKDGWDTRFVIYFAPIFHQQLAKVRSYGIKEGECGGYNTIPVSAWHS
jgi:hypothetical protein